MRPRGVVKVEYNTSREADLDEIVPIRRFGCLVSCQLYVGVLRIETGAEDCKLIFRHTFPTRYADNYEEALPRDETLDSP